MSGIIRTHVKRKIAAVLLATMLLDQLPVTVYAEPLESETLAEPAGQEQPAPEGSMPVSDEQAGSEEAEPAAEEQVGSEETASADTPEAGGEDTAEEAAGTQDNVSYIDADGQTKNHSATALTGSETSLNPGWYVVNGNIIFRNTVILNGSGEYHIILEDDKTMQIGESSGSGINDGVGLGCAYDDSRKDDINLYIYAQSSGNSAGQLNIYASYASPQDRSENEKVGDAINVDELTINGGKLNLDVTGLRSYGINSKKLTINGGDITANATVYLGNSDLMPGGWAIRSAGDFTINDGNVTAQSGGGNGHAVLVDDNGSFTMNNGELTAVAKADGIGLRADEDIIIKGGKVNVESNMGDGMTSSTGNITINGGQVIAKGAQGYFGGIRISNSMKSLYLSWTELTDFIEVNKFSIAGSTADSVTIPAGKAFKDGNGKYYVRANANTIKGLTNVKLSATADKIHVVNFECGEYATTPDKQIVKNGSKATAPTDPKSGSTLDGKSFVGWYQDTEFQIPFDFNSAVTSDLYLHAKWATLDHNIENVDVKQIYRHTGSAVQPVVKNNIGETLTKGTDYTISIESEKTNSNVTEMKDPGFYNLTITGKSPYSGIRTVRVCVLTFGKYDPSTRELNNNATLPENTDAAVVTDSTVSMNSGWYVVTEDVDVNTRMKVEGDVHLVLCDGTTLNAAGNDGRMGISVTEGNSLTIYSQEGNTGKLLAYSNQANFYAGIGGNSPDKSSSDLFPYLEKNKNAGDITIHGGEIYARGSYGSAAIGMAEDGQGGRITIYGGKVTASRFSSTGTSTGIGGQNADIHLSWCRPYEDFILSDGYQGSVSFDKSFIIEDTSTIATRDDIAQFSGKKIEPVESFETHTVTFDSNGGTAVETQTVAMNKKAKKPVTPIRQGYSFAGWFKDTGLSQGYNFDTKVTEDFTLYAKWEAVSAIAYIGEDGNVSGFTDYSPMEADYEVLPTGSYYVENDAELLNRVRVNGDVSLILKDGTTLTAPNGISVMGREKTLNIFGQSGGTGILKAKAVSNNAAIGGDDGEQQLSGSVGNINIYGGNIRVQGGNCAASIGGGNLNEYYGNICIYGGKISGIDGDAARGGVLSAAIGGGFARDNEFGKNVDGTVRILGGEVTVESLASGSRRTGIGGGQYGYGGTIDILGGKVEVTGVQPGIGDGDSYTGEKKARITLGCKNQDDRISSAYYNGKVRVAPNQTLKIKDTSTSFTGDISNVNDINGKTLILSHSHNFLYTNSGTTTTITATCQNDGCDLPSKTATLTLKAPDAADLVYDDTGKPAIVTDEYHISGDEVVHYQKKNGSSWIDAGTAAPKDAGDYKATITLTDAQTQSTAAVSVEYTITKRDVTIAGLAANNKIYDGTAAASVNDTAIDLVGKIEGDAVSIGSGNAAFDTADAGENKTVTFTGYSLTGSAAGNYNLVSQPDSVTADIEKRSATVKALDQTVQPGEKIRQDMVTVEGLADGQEFVSVKLTPDPDPEKTQKPMGNGTIIPSNAVIKIGNTDVTGNYEISYVGGSLTITLPMAKITKHPTVRTNLKYDGHLNEQALVNPGEAETRMEYNVQRIADGNGNRLKEGDRYVDEITPYEGYGNDYTAWESGSYRVWYRAASGNRLIASEPEYVSVNIAQIPLTVKVVDETIPYGEKFKLSMNAVKEGFHDRSDRGAIGAEIWYYQINGKWITFSDAGVKDTYPDLGAYPVKIQYERDNVVRDCYKIDSVPGFLYVVPRTVSLNWGDTSFTFNGKPQVPTVELTNLSENEVPGAVGVTVSGAQVNAGTYTAAAVALSGDKASKYALPAENTVKFSIAKADYSREIPNIALNVPVSADSYKVFVAGKMPSDAGRLEYKNVTISSNGPDATGFKAFVDENGLVTVTKTAGTQLNQNDKLYVNVDVDSTNYKTKTIKTVATFVDKSDAGVGITQGNSLSVNYGEVETLTLNATASHPGTSGTWTWDSSNTGVATAASSNGNCMVTIKGVGTAAITAKYDSATTTGYATLILTVNPISVPVPAAITGLSYNESQQTGVATGTYYTLTGEKGTLPGDYVATATLNEPGKHRWSDGTIEVKYIPWTIEKQAGPAAPGGLKGVIPTTPDNIDGRITGVDFNMEYSKDTAFSKAIPCTGSEIVGLKDGTYYVRYKETEFVKAGAAAEVVIPRVAPPIVRAIQGLVYNGSPQVLVTADTVSEGKIYYAVTGRNDPEPDKAQYSTTLPAKTNAGSYRVWYEIRGAGDPPESGALYVELAQIDLRQDLYYINLSANGIYGMDGMVDISSRVPEGACPRLRVYTSNVYKALKDVPTIDNPQAGADTMRLHYSVKKEEDCYPVSSETVRYELFTVSADQMVNYRDYNVEIKVEFYKECATGHADAELLNTGWAPTCMKKGSAGDRWCHDCHGIIKGEILPIDPDAHDFDMEHGEVTKKPTSFTPGEHTYYCRHNRAHTLVIPDIPILPSDDGTDYTDLIKDVKSLSGNAALTQSETVDPETGEVTTTVTVGGEVISKIVRDPESGRETVESKIWAGGLQSSYTYTGSAIRPSFRVYDGTRKLTEKKDYSVKYKKNKTVGTANIILKFKGNYKGTGMQTIDFSIVPAVLGRDVLAYDTGVTAQSKAQKPVPTMILAATGKAVSPKFFTATYDGADSVTGEGTYTATVSSKNKYYEGTTSANITVVKDKNLLLSNARVVFDQKSCFYTGNEILPSYKVTLGGKTLEKDVDFTETVYNGKDPGTAALMITAKPGNESGYVGSKLSSFKIRGNRKLVNAEPFSFDIQKSVPFSKSGAKASVVVKDGALTLKEGVDYTLSYRKNKAVTNGETAEAVVKGKGIYKGSVTLKYAIIRQSLSANGIYVEAADQFTALKDLASPVVTVTDGDGKKLKAETDYTVLEVDTSAPGNTEESGEVFVTITGKGNYSEAPVKTSFRYDAASQDIGKTKLKKSISPQTYTGSYVYLGNEDLSGILYAGSKASPVYLTPGKDFTVCNYRNNRSRGKAKVTVRGIGAFAGTKVLTFKITQKKGDYKGALVGDKWQ